MFAVPQAYNRDNSYFHRSQVGCEDEYIKSYAVLIQYNRVISISWINWCKEVQVRSIRFPKAVSTVPSEVYKSSDTGFTENKVRIMASTYRAHLHELLYCTD